MAAPRIRTIIPTSAEWEQLVKPTTYTQVVSALRDFPAHTIVPTETVMYFGPACAGCRRVVPSFTALSMWKVGDVVRAVYGLCVRCAGEQQISATRGEIVGRCAEGYITGLLTQRERALAAQAENGATPHG